MPSFGPNGVIHGEPVQLCSGVFTAGGNGAPAGSAQASTARLSLDVTAASGTTPSLTVNIQTSHDGATWVTVGSFAARTAPGSERKVFNGLDQFVRASWTVTGTTPSFSASVNGVLV